MVHLIPMTVRGAEKLRKELEQLKNTKRPRIIIEIAKAREHGDLKENAEYHSAREEQSFCEGRIKDIELKLSNCQIIDITKIPNDGRVVFGSTVTILNIQSNEIFTYQIVGDDESDFKKNLISINSPMSRGLIGKTVNTIATIFTPSGNIKYKILKIDYI
ncbi:transcription elongation factor GreA [Buchnera aphidicola (Aphis craccivora)]|uniref:Transcription elongation factor GreA n=1 Tax=Buchnera aphidicola (Aphis craccivora) TaxID=466616 RepID=A0A4D6XNC9_9GAMM|nr:transcription elongation factor GreA [Buchnera aphidicola]QCI16624.1 transcription elongation factor GreA [Buchnera aphidicola (Aphis craccivora)]QLL40758.1 transcription elongation factor GreA [Buchnera aphidicola (Aphis craccivore)]WAI17597.1 MAG: transcription elongation factor GreA [Buchnera aphidicola (Aphis craccivora)]